MSRMDCGVCGKSFESMNGYRTHFGMKHPDANLEELDNPPKPTKEKIIDLYENEGKTMYDIADIYDVNPATVLNWMKEYSIERQYPTGENHPQYNSVTVECKYCGKRIERRKPVLERTRYGSFCSYRCWGKWMWENSDETDISLPLETPSGEDHPNYDRVEVNCSICGKKMRIIRYKAEHYNNHFCSDKCELKWRRKAFVGENNLAWRGGYEPWYGSNWQEQRRKALERDNYACQICGTSERLEVHHKTPVREFEVKEESNKLDNLVTLCKSCHLVIENPNRQKQVVI